MQNALKVVRMPADVTTRAAANVIQPATMVTDLTLRTKCAKVCILFVVLSQHCTAHRVFLIIDVNTFLCFFYFKIKKPVFNVLFYFPDVLGKVPVICSLTKRGSLMIELFYFRPSRGADANQQKLVTVRSYTENYRQSYSIRTVKDWNALPQSVVSAGSLALFKSPLSSHVAP